MDTHARVLFGAAALFNFAVAAALLFPPLQLGPWMGIPVVSGVELQIFNVAGALIACFGYGYWLVARNWRKFRPFIEIAVLGKMLAVIAVTVPAVMGAASWRLPALASGDLMFAALFLQFLKRTAPAMPADS